MLCRQCYWLSFALARQWRMVMMMDLLVVLFGEMKEIDERL